MLTIDYDGRAVAYDFGELDAVVLAYATTTAGRRWSKLREWLAGEMKGMLPAGLGSIGTDSRSATPALK